MHKKTIVIAGPTASGKTSLACAIANSLDSGVISADSRQVYRGMDLGTGKDINEYTLNGATIPYHCIDIAEPTEIYTLYEYQREAYSAFTSYFSKEKTPIFCGGTGLYIEAVLKKYEIANVPESEAFRISEMQRDQNELIAELQRRSPHLYKKTDCSSKKRVVRALEIANAEELGPVSYGCDNAPDIAPLILITDWSREKLIERIDNRLDERLSQGMILEVENLLDKGVSRERMNLFGMEYKQICRFLFNEIDFPTMRKDLSIEIHRLAKRQRTWFRGMERRGLKTIWVPEADLSFAQEKVEHFLQ